MGSYKWGYKPPNMAYKYSYPTELRQGTSAALEVRVFLKDLGLLLRRGGLGLTWASKLKMCRV